MQESPEATAKGALICIGPWLGPAKDYLLCALPLILAPSPPVGLFFAYGIVMEDKRQWHMEKSVSVSHIVATSTLLFAGVAAFFGLQERISVLENEFVNLSERVVRVLEAQQRVDDAQDRDLVSFRNEVRADISQINNKLDRLIEALVERK